MEFTDRILEKCRRAGAEMAEVFNITQRSLSISVRNGEVETVANATPGGLAIRFYTGRKMAFAHTTDLSDSSVDAIIPRLLRLARGSAVDEYAALPGSQQYPDSLDLYDPIRTEEPMESKIQYLRDLEKMALQFDPLIQKSNGASYEEWVATRSLSNTNGVQVNYDSTFYRVGISMVASRGGEMYPGEGSLFARHFDDLPEQPNIVEQFASKAARLVGGTPVEGGMYEIIFTPRAANSILWGLSFALDGDNAYTGASFLTGKTGSKIAVDGLTLFDDALRPRGIASRPADDEGVASTRQTLIENGYLKGFLYDFKTAAKAKATPTGSAARDDYGSFPGIWHSNFYIAPGRDKVEDVIASCKKGIIVEDTAGWGLHSVTGEYSAGINGILVEKGKRIRPVAGVTIAASANDILMGLGAICDDITFYDDMCSPSLMVKGMKVGA